MTDYTAVGKKQIQNSGSYIKKVLKIELLERLDMRLVQQSNHLDIVMRDMASGYICVIQFPGSCLFFGPQHFMFGTQGYICCKKWRCRLFVAKVEVS